MGPRADGVWVSGGMVVLAMRCRMDSVRRAGGRRCFAREPIGANKSKRAEAFASALPRHLAEWTGLEPATPGVTGRYSNQLNYHSRILRPLLRWWVLRGSNPRHSPCKGDALPAELSTPPKAKAPGKVRYFNGFPGRFLAARPGQNRSFIHFAAWSNRFFVTFEYWPGVVWHAVHGVSPCAAPSITMKSLSVLAAMSKYCSASRMK